MACPISNEPDAHEDRSNPSRLNYTSYLQLNKLLDCVTLATADAEGGPIHDEHLFITIHQVYEIWFKQIIHELDSIMKFFRNDNVDERNMLLIISRFNRINMITKILVEQISIIETMTPLDFANFRPFLQSASGFQSYQFRLIENKVGIKAENRITYNKHSYMDGITDSEIYKKVDAAEKADTLIELVDGWLSRTPGLKDDDFNFFTYYRIGVERYLCDLEYEAEALEDHSEKDIALASFNKIKESFMTILHKDKHDDCVRRGIRRLSHASLIGGVFIWSYREEPRFHMPYQLMSLFMEFDTLFIKWRHSHAQMVQKMLGNKIGSGGSSGYYYLRATASDRYKVFLDLCMLPTFVLPREYIPKLSQRMRTRLSVCLTES